MIGVVELIADLTDAFVVLLLTAGMVLAIGRSVLSIRELRALGGGREAMHAVFREIRFDLGHILLLALEILIISDILHSIVKRTFEEVGILAITVAIRIALSFFLDREISAIGTNPGHGSKR